jgi:hypothetical protein
MFLKYLVLKSLNDVSVAVSCIPTAVCHRAVASTKETTLIGRISDVVRPERGTDFVA